MRPKLSPILPNIVLGNNFARFRKMQGITQMQLGRKVNETWQKIDKYEHGTLIPAPMIERLAESMGLRVPKKLIRKIINSRKLDMEEKIPQDDELVELYNEIFVDVFATDEEEEVEDEEAEEE